MTWAFSENSDLKKKLQYLGTWCGYEVALFWTNTQQRLSRFVSLLRSFFKVFFIKKTICNSFAASKDSGARFISVQCFLSSSQSQFHSVTDVVMFLLYQLWKVLSPPLGWKALYKCKLIVISLWVSLTVHCCYPWNFALVIKLLIIQYQSTFKK